MEVVIGGVHWRWWSSWGGGLTRASPILLICLNANHVDHCSAPRTEPYKQFNRKRFFPGPPRNVLILLIDPVSGWTLFKDFSKRFEAYKLVKTSIFSRLKKVFTLMAAIYCSFHCTHCDSFVLRKFFFLIGELAFGLKLFQYFKWRKLQHYSIFFLRSTAVDVS